MSAHRTAPAQTRPDRALADAASLAARAAPAAPPLLDHVLVRGGLTLIRGEFGVGKSWLALSMAHVVAAGTGVLGWRAKRPGRVLYVDGALSEGILSDRLRALASGLGRCEFGWLLVLGAGLGVRLPDLGMEEGTAAMEAMIPSDLDLLVLDGLPTLVPPGPGAAARMQHFCDWVERLRRHGLAVLVVDGPRRAATSMLDERADIVLALKPPPDYDIDMRARFRLRCMAARALVGPAARWVEARLDVRDGRAIWTCLDARDEDAREAAGLKAAGHTVREIARHLGVSAATAWRLVHRGKAEAPAQRAAPPDPGTASRPHETVKQPEAAAARETVKQREAAAREILKQPTRDRPETAKRTADRRPETMKQAGAAALPPPDPPWAAGLKRLPVPESFRQRLYGGVSAHALGAAAGM